MGGCYLSVDGAHSDKPSNMTRMMPQPLPTFLSFEYRERGNSTKERWYCCSYCKSATVITEMHVGHVFGDSESDIRPVQEWDMTIPDPV